MFDSQEPSGSTKEDKYFALRNKNAAEGDKILRSKGKSRKKFVQNAFFLGMILQRYSIESTTVNKYFWLI